MDNNVLVLDINASTFTQLKDDFNDVLKEVLDNLVGRYLTEADITVSVHLRFEHDSKGALVAPVIQHVVKSVYKQTAMKDGTLAPANMELVKDKDTGAYVFRHIDDGQQDIFADDSDQAEPDVVNAATVPAGPALPEPERPADDVVALPESISDTDTSSPCKTCSHYKDGQPCGIECDAEYSGYEAKIDFDRCEDMTEAAGLAADAEIETFGPGSDNDPEADEATATDAELLAECEKTLAIDSNGADDSSTDDSVDSDVLSNPATFDDIVAASEKLLGVNKPAEAPAARDDKTCKFCHWSLKSGEHGNSKTCKVCLQNPEVAGKVDCWEANRIYRCTHECVHRSNFEFSATCRDCEQHKYNYFIPDGNKSIECNTCANKAQHPLVGNCEGCKDYSKWEPVLD